LAGFELFVCVPHAQLIDHFPCHTLLLRPKPAFFPDREACQSFIFVHWYENSNSYEKSYFHSAPTRLRSRVLSSKQHALLVASKRVGEPLKCESSRRRSLPVCYGNRHRSIGFQPVESHPGPDFRTGAKEQNTGSTQAGSLCSCARQLNASADFELVFCPRSSTHCWQQGV
jgi:hypothetical protein